MKKVFKDENSFNSFKKSSYSWLEYGKGKERKIQIKILVHYNISLY